jgi:hypothetical protein
MDKGRLSLLPFFYFSQCLLQFLILKTDIFNVVQLIVPKKWKQQPPTKDGMNYLLMQKYKQNFLIV